MTNWYVALAQLIIPITGVIIGSWLVQRNFVQQAKFRRSVEVSDKIVQYFAEVMASGQGANRHKKFADLLRSMLSAERKKDFGDFALYADDKAVVRYLDFHKWAIENDPDHPVADFDIRKIKPQLRDLLQRQAEVLLEFRKVYHPRTKLDGYDILFLFGINDAQKFREQMEAEQ